MQKSQGTHLESIYRYPKYTSEGAEAGNDVVITCFWVKVKDKAAEQGEQDDGFQQSGNLGDSPRATALTVCVASFWFWSWRPTNTWMASVNKPRVD